MEIKRFSSGGARQPRDCQFFRARSRPRGTAASQALLAAPGPGAQGVKSMQALPFPLERGDQPTLEFLFGSNGGSLVVYGT